MFNNISLDYERKKSSWCIKCKCVLLKTYKKKILKKTNNNQLTKNIQKQYSVRLLNILSTIGTFSCLSWDEQEQLPRVEKNI